jgi:hypothetical protein
MAARLYAERLTLDWIDRFFGDAGMGERTLFPLRIRSEDVGAALDGSRV